jgi:5'-nucleotidase
MRRPRLLLAAAVVGLGALAAVPAGAIGRGTAGPSTTTLRILVTNDDGVSAPGLAKLVNALQTLPDVEITVVAPATNQSGVGDTFSTGVLTATPTTTASGDAATSVSGTPADSVLYAVKVLMPDPPHVVVSGVNQGQNLGNITPISGTVGAARTANRLGIPAIAVSAGSGTKIGIAYSLGGGFAAGWVGLFHDTYADESSLAQTLNVNVPTCAVGSGSVRGTLVLPLGRTAAVGSYTIQSGVPGNGTVQTNLVTKNAVMANVNCASTATGMDNDIDGFNEGFITLTRLNPDLEDL